MIKPLYLLSIWLQVIPIALLMFSPFEDEDLRLRRSVCYLISVLWLAFACIVLVVLSTLLGIGGRRNHAVQNLILTVMLVLSLIWWAAVVKAPAAHKTLYAGMMIHYACILSMLGSVFASLILRDRYLSEIRGNSGSLTFFLCLLGATLLTWPLVWLFAHHILRKNLPALDKPESKRGLRYILLVLITFYLVSYTLDYDSQPDALIIAATLIITDVTVYYIFFQEIGAVRRHAETARQLEIYQVQFQQLSRRMEETRRLRHDMRQHLNVLGVLNAQGKQTEIAEYLKKYGTVYLNYEKQRLYGDPVVDSVLNYYLARAEQEHIPVTCRVLLKDVCRIDPMDITVLLGNCLENATEALRQLPPEERRLEIDLRPSGVVLLLRVVNTCANLRDSGDFSGWESFPSTKHASRKGIGLRSITNIAEQYGGNAQFQQKDGVFTTRVILKFP